MYPLFFIHLSINEYLSLNLEVCFQVLAIVNSAAMNTGVKTTFLCLVIK